DRLPLTVLPTDAGEAFVVARDERTFGVYGPELIDLPDGSWSDVSVVESAEGRVRLALQYGPPREMGERQVLGLFEAIAFGVEHSRAYQTRMEQVYLSALDVTLERYLLSPRPF